MRRICFTTAVCLVCALARASGDQKKNTDSRFYCLDLQPKANARVLDMFSGDDNGEGKLTPGERTLEGVKFKIGAKYLQLGSTNQPNGPAKLGEIKVDRVLTKLHLLQATGWSTADDTIIGEYVVTCVQGFPSSQLAATT